MFRPLRRKKRAITDEEARELLATCKRGVFAVNGDDGYPYVIPVNYFFDAEHDKIYFHGAKAGHKVDALKRDDKVCFTVYGNEWYKDGDWAPYVMSTVVFGRCRLANDTPRLSRIKFASSRLSTTLLPKKSKRKSPRTLRASSSTRLRLSIFAASRFKKNKPPQQVCAQWLQTFYHAGPSSRLGRRPRMQCSLTVH